MRNIQRSKAKVLRYVILPTLLLSFRAPLIVSSVGHLLSSTVFHLPVLVLVLVFQLPSSSANKSQHVNVNVNVNVSVNVDYHN